MTMFFFLFVLPLTSALSPSDPETVCPPMPDVTCDEDQGEILCLGEEVDGCYTEDYCVTQYGNCTAFCNTICNEEQVLCQGGVGPDGCQMPDYCAEETDNGDGYKCPAVCDLVICKDDEELCQTVGEDGCQIDAPECVKIGMCNDLPCPEIPPAECPEGMVQVLGGDDSYGCPMPDYCQCPEPAVPVECADDEMWCDLGNDENDCWLGSECAKECADSIDNYEVNN